MTEKEEQKALQIINKIEPNGELINTHQALQMMEEFAEYILSNYEIEK